MTDYIKREDAIKAICDSIPHSCNMEDCEFGCIATTLLPIPAADVVERKHGKWLDVTTLDNEFICWVCSECRHGADFVYEPYNYCPNCGADMRGES